MLFSETDLLGAFVIDLEPLEDERGFFAREFCQEELRARGLKPIIAQANLTFTAKAGTVRGMHFQYSSAAEAKLIRCVRGAILDIIVDLRPESPSFLQHVSVELSEDNWRALYVPERFAHGYQSLEDKTVTIYSASEFYTPAAEGGLRHDDPVLGLTWPLPVSVISKKDCNFLPYERIEEDLRQRMCAASLSPSSEERN